MSERLMKIPQFNDPRLKYAGWITNGGHVVTDEAEALALLDHPVRGPEIRREMATRARQEQRAREFSA